MHTRYVIVSKKHICNYQFKIFHFYTFIQFTDCNERWLELDSDSCWAFMEKWVEHNKANEYCEKHHHGKLLEVVGKKFPETLKNVYDPELMKETWIFNKVGTSSYIFHTLQNCLKFTYLFRCTIVLG